MAIYSIVDDILYFHLLSSEIILLLGPIIWLVFSAVYISESIKETFVLEFYVKAKTLLYR